MITGHQTAPPIRAGPNIDSFEPSHVSYGGSQQSTMCSSPSDTDLERRCTSLMRLAGVHCRTCMPSACRTLWMLRRTSSSQYHRSSSPHPSPSSRLHFFPLLQALQSCESPLKRLQLDAQRRRRSGFRPGTLNNYTSSATHWVQFCLVHNVSLTTPTKMMWALSLSFSCEGNWPLLQYATT